MMGNDAGDLQVAADPGQDGLARAARAQFAEHRLGPAWRPRRALSHEMYPRPWPQVLALLPRRPADQGRLGEQDQAGRGMTASNRRRDGLARFSVTTVSRSAWFDGVTIG